YAFMPSVAFTSVAGSLYALMVGFVDPESGFGILRSVELIITAALGGAGSLFGPLLGAAILIPLQTATNTFFGGGGTGLTYILYGGIILPPPPLPPRRPLGPRPPPRAPRRPRDA